MNKSCISNNCEFWCLLASGLFASQIYIMLNPQKTLIIKDFQASLTPEQNKIYLEIVKERLNIYLGSLFLGLTVGFLYLTMQPHSLVRTCVFTVLVLSVNIFVYMVVPKSNYIINHLTNESQLKKWTNVYKEMQYRKYIGFLIGVVAYLLLAHNLN